MTSERATNLGIAGLALVVGAAQVVRAWSWWLDYQTRRKEWHATREVAK